MELPGHVGMALVFTAPAWLVMPRSAAAVFVGFAVSVSMLPDVDLVLPIAHHSVTHTFVFVVAASVVLGAVVAGLDESLRDDGPPRGVERSIFVFSTAAFLVGSGSHIVADMLTAPDVSQPIEPFWPLFDASISIDVLYYSSAVANYGTLVIGLGLSLAFYVAARMRDDEPAVAA